MISILIPVYNFDVRKLIEDICNECTTNLITFECLVYDDGSLDSVKQINKTITNHKNLIYKELDVNIGRSRIRNLLAQNANFNYLIFLDCDAKIIHNTFIKDYIQALARHKVVCGGTAYDAHSKEHLNNLRWHYGLKREMISAEVRSENPNKSFSTFNFAIHKDIFLNIQFSENINQYGHEDTLFGLQLKQKNISIYHINNQVLHIGIESTRAFLNKTETSIKTLAQLHSSGVLTSEFIEDINLLRTFNTLKKLKAVIVLKLFYIIFGAVIKKLICVFPKRIILFDIYKLLFLAYITL